MDEPFQVPNVPKGGATPPKYIRTFSGDMETLEEGGTPDLAPLKESHATPAERLVAPSPIPEAPAAAVPPAPSAPEAAKYTPPLAEIAPVETYGADFINRIQTTKASTATLLAAEQDQAPRAEPAAEAPEESRGNKLLIIGGIALLLIGGGGAAYAYWLYAASHAPVPVAEAPVSAPIFVDERAAVPGSGQALAAAIAQSVAKPITSGSVRLLSPATSSQSVFVLLAGTAPGILTRNITPAGSMAGVVSVGGVQSPFFILSVSSYSDTFAGMLSWETVMPRDLAILYPTYPSAPVVTVSSTAATSTPAATSTAPASPLSLQPAGFHDETTSNHDVRVYRDSSGRSVLMYGYWNQTTLIIARDPAAFAEIVGRLATSRS